MLHNHLSNMYSTQYSTCFSLPNLSPQWYKRVSSTFHRLDCHITSVIFLGLASLFLLTFTRIPWCMKFVITYLTCFVHCFQVQPIFHRLHYHLRVHLHDHLSGGGLQQLQGRII